VIRTAIFIAVLAGTMLSKSSTVFAQLDAAPSGSTFRLVGTVESGPFTGAVIDDTTNPQAFYRLNAKLPDGSQLVEVQSNHIILKEPDGTLAALYVTPGSGGGRVPVPAPSAAPRRVDAPTPEQRAELIRSRAAEARANASAASGTGQPGGRSPGIDRQRPDRPGMQREEGNASKRGSRGRRGRPRPEGDN
jgi:hypothetical protein